MTQRKNRKRYTLPGMKYTRDDQYSTSSTVNTVTMLRGDRW